MKDIEILVGRVLIQRLEAKTETPGGILLPDVAKEKPQKGKVISVGKGKMLENGKREITQVKRGDIVLFTNYTGTEIKIDDQEYLVLDESDLIAIIHE